MASVREQLEIHEVTFVNSRDSSQSFRTSTHIIFTVSKQLLHIARETQGPIPLDCSASTIRLMEKLGWGQAVQDDLNDLEAAVSLASG